MKKHAPGCNCCDEAETCADCFPDGEPFDIEVDLAGIGVFTVHESHPGTCSWEYDSIPIDCDNPEIHLAFVIAGGSFPETGWYVGIQDFSGGFPSLASSDYIAGPLTCE